MRSKYYAGATRAIIGGVPVRIFNSPSANTLAMMREGEPSRAGARERYEATAEQYARWLAARDGIAIQSKKTIKAIPVYEVPEGKAWKERRIQAVRFESGHESHGYHSWDVRGWNTDEVLATIQIPNWDHDPVATIAA